MLILSREHIKWVLLLVFLRLRMWGSFWLQVCISSLQLYLFKYVFSFLLV